MSTDDGETETTLEQLVYGSVGQIDEETFVDLFLRSEIDLHRNPLQRSIFETITDYSHHRSWNEVKSKYHELLNGDIDDTREIDALMALKWVLQGDADWPFDDRD